MNSELVEEPSSRIILFVYGRAATRFFTPNGRAPTDKRPHPSLFFQIVHPLPFQLKEPMPSAYPARLVNVDLTNFQRNVPTYPVIYNEFDDASAMMGDTYRLSIYTMDTQFVDNKKRKKEEEKEEIRGKKTEEKRRGAGEEEGRKNMKG